MRSRSAEGVLALSSSARPAPRFRLAWPDWAAAFLLGLATVGLGGTAGAGDGRDSVLEAVLAQAPPSEPGYRPTFGLAQAGAVLLAQADSPAPDVLGDIDEEAFDEEDFSDLLDETAIPEASDPLEGVNRVIFDANLALDRWLLRPVTRIYVETVPEPGRNGVANLLANVNSPITFVNDILQGEMSRAGTTFGRFFINTVFGLGGMIDVAEELGLPGHTEDFGQTLGSYGVGGNPYLVLPIFGPSSPRDAIGRGVDILTDPLTHTVPTGLGRIKTGVQLISDRERILDETDTLEATSVDFYAAIRSFYYQNREFEIANGREIVRPAPGTEIEEDLYDDIDDEELEDLEPDLQSN